MAFSVSYIYDLVDRYSAKLKKITAATKRFQKRIKSVSISVRKFGNRMKIAGRKMSSFIGSAAGIAAIAFPVKAAINFESAMVEVQKAVDGIESAAAFKKIKGLVFNLSRELRMAPAAVADLVAAAGRMGIPLEQMESFLRVAGSASVALNLSSEATGVIIGNIRKQMGLSIDSIETLLDSVAHLENKTSASGAAILNILERTAGGFAALKFPPEIAAGWAAATKQMIRSPELAASGLDMMLAAIRTKMPELQKEMDVDPSGALMKYFGKLSKLSMPDLRKSLKDFGAGGGYDVALQFALRYKELGEVMGEVTDKTKYLGAMKVELNKKLKSTASKLDAVTVELKIAAICIGDELIPHIQELSEWLKPIIKRMTDWIKNNKKATKWIMIIIGALAILGPVIIGLGFLIAALGVIFNLAFAPVTLIVLGIIAVIAGLIYVFMNFGKVVTFIKEKFIELWKWCKPVAIILGVLFGPVIITVLALVGAVKALIWAYKKLAGMRKDHKEKMGKKGSSRFGGITSEEADYVMSDEVYSKKDINHSINHNPQSVNLNGQINVGVDGGSVKNSSMETNTGGNLGFNNPAYAH